MVERCNLTRRSILAGLAAAVWPVPSFALPDQATPELYIWPEPVDLSDNLQLSDWRFSQSDGGSRFLAEVKNTSGEIVISPTIGVVLPDLRSSGNFGWASAFTPVIHPGESTFVIGLTPTAGVRPDDWDGAEWMLCEPGDVAFDPRDKLEGLDYALEFASTVHRPDWMECSMSVTNRGAKPIWSMRLAGIVRDAEGRVCGGTAFSNLANIVSGETLEMKVNVRPNVTISASPFDFVEDLGGGTASFSIQPPGAAVNQGCPAVMPWNR